ncbi:CYTOCHROME P450 83B1 [Salix koriyanagi]|uniref:CYTOCHROME P450 83B1 n=1 Tax=Salix koriyanagi TaxID=2511006 RepID=A0A9Q0VET4_9ROSI|nr:CYTOCHROME P450 83B1 [Salix koriyanagi]
MVSLFFLVILSLPIFLLFLLKKNTTTKTSRLPPGPRGLPLVGNLHQLDSCNLQKHLWQLSQKYGPLFTLRLGFRRTLVACSAKMAKEILKTHDLEFCSRPVLTGQQKLSYSGLDLAFSRYGVCWREMRKICVIHLFSSIRVQSFSAIREEEVSHMIAKISISDLDSEPFNLTEAMMSLTSTIICRIAFGKSYEDGGSEKSKFQDLLNESQAMFSIFFFSDYFQYMGWVDRLTGLARRLGKNFKEFDAFYQQIIDEHLDPNRSKPEHEDILDVLLQIYKDRPYKTQLTFDHIKAILMNIFVAGTDTSAATVIWSMCFLMKNPEALKKVQEEVRTAIGNKGYVNEYDVEQLCYLKAVVKETMRLQPTTPLLIPRETTEKCKIHEYEIPAKTLVYVNAWAVGRDSEAWENPNEFNPDRFMGSSIDFKGQDFKLIPFGSGRRMCPGLEMGIATVELSLANLLHKFDWETPAGIRREDIDIDHVIPGITTHRRDPLCLVPKPYAVMGNKELPI